MAPQKEDVICTLVTNDKYAIGAIVVARSLKLAGTKHKLAILVTDGVSLAKIAELETLYTHIIPVSNMTNTTSTKGLTTMGRPDLAITFTKLTLWQQTQFRRILYLDADTLVLRNPDSLFSLPTLLTTPFAAAPELGFPDCFNSGVMFLRPSLSVFDDLADMASQPNASFDGGDQGLLNQYFRDNWTRLSFMWNCEVNKVYHLYMPALKFYKEELGVVHFIGRDKPWDLSRGMDVPDSSPYARFFVRLVGRWWDVWEMEGKVVEGGEGEKGRERGKGEMGGFVDVFEEV